MKEKSGKSTVLNHTNQANQINHSLDNTGNAMRKGWEIKIFEDCLDKVTYSNKIKRQNFLDEGEYPVISQEKEFVNGYWNGKSDLFKIKKPVIIFGDHTQVLKYIDFDFVIGADGVKILSPIREIESKYFYYFLQSIPLKELGYARHYRLLKEISVSYPKLPSEQKRIVAILDEAFAAIDKAKANILKNLQNAKELFESYLQGVFENKGEDWEEKRLKEIASVFGGYSFKSKDFKSSGMYQVLRMGNIRPGIIRNEESPVFIEKVDESVLKRALLKKDDVVITQTGTKKKRDYGFTVIIDKDNYLVNQRIAAIRFPGNYLSKFFLYYSWTNYFKDQYFANETGTVGQGNVGIGAVTDALVPFCSIEEQRRVVSDIDTILFHTNKLETIHQKKLDDLEELKKSILQKAFNGELTEKNILV